MQKSILSALNIHEYKRPCRAHARHRQVFTSSPSPQLAAVMLQQADPTHQHRQAN